MQSLRDLDSSLFQWVNLKLANPVFDLVMPGVGATALLAPILVVLGLVVLWKYRLRGLIFMLVCLAATLTCDALCHTLKDAVGRDRPFLVLENARCLIGRGDSGSMPSNHASNWFAAAMVALIYFRKSAWLMLPLACTIGFSRVYNGVHYPSDVAAGAILGAGHAAAFVWVLDALWRWLGSRWFPLWWARLPSLIAPPDRLLPELQEECVPVRGRQMQTPVPQTSLDAHWLRLGYVVILLLLAARWMFISSDVMQLSEDEAYQWVWSRHLDLSYYSKPPLIAYTQFLGTTLWGNNAFGVRFFSPLIAAVLGFLLLRFFARAVNARAGFFLLLMVTATPLMAAGSILMTVDPLSVLFWTTAMLAGWRASGEKGSTRDWLLVGLWMGLGFLSKYTALFQLLCWVVYFALSPPARKHLQRPGPYLALVVNAACMAPVLIWNAQRDWITVTHVAQNAGAYKAWHPTLRYLAEFLGAELGLLNPVFFTAMIWAGIAMWRRHRHNPLLVYCFSMGAPLFLSYLLHSFKGRVFPNWIAPSVVPLFCMMVIYWDARWRLGQARLRPWLVAGLLVGFLVGAVGHDTRLVQRLTGQPLPIKYDPMRRVREWDQTAAVANQVRQELAAEGKPVFIIGAHYGMVGQLTFYLPEAKEHVRDHPLVYYRSSPVPENQFYFLPGYTERKGENAVYVVELDRDRPRQQVPPADLLKQFDSVTEAGIRPVLYQGRPLRYLQFFLCRGLR